MLKFFINNFTKRIFFFLPILFLVSCTTINNKYNEKISYVEGRFSYTIYNDQKKSFQGRFYWSFSNFKELFILKDPWNNSQNKISREFINGKYTDWYFLNHKNQLISKEIIKKELDKKLKSDFNVNEYIKLINKISIFFNNYISGKEVERKLNIQSPSENMKLLLIIDK